jgi:hypothetical protein
MCFYNDGRIEYIHCFHFSRYYIHSSSTFDNMLELLYFYVGYLSSSYLSVAA